ncbi:N-alpha-acetyltransferase 60-like [Panonychus citri]|uniref:N-alpha-acetyltransferase 60-like n=1 Tax=Panonychus citri TaxID=50023 RepID=UPI0023071F74|nr:N-alpha-acetyltransferase 60-like [Panonychus citri]
MITVNIAVDNQLSPSSASCSSCSGVKSSYHCVQDNLRFRKLCPNDLETLKHLCEDWFPITYPVEWYNAVINGEYFYPWAATINGKIVGVIVADIWCRSDCDHCDRDILPGAKFPDDSKVAYILTFGVVKEYRRYGIGSRLLDKLINELTTNIDLNDTAKTVKAVYLHVLCDNKTAITFYKSKSFRIHRYLPWYYCNSAGNGDAYSYVRYINGATTSWIYSYPFARCPIVGIYQALGKLPHLLWRVFRVLKIYRIFIFRVSEKMNDKPKEITA